MNSSQQISNKDKFNSSVILNNNQQYEHQLKKNNIFQDQENYDQVQDTFEEFKSQFDNHQVIEVQQKSQKKNGRKKLKYKQSFPTQLLENDVFLVNQVQENICLEEEENQEVIEQSYQNELNQVSQEHTKSSYKSEMDKILQDGILESDHAANETNYDKHREEFWDKYGLKDDMNQNNQVNLNDFCENIQQYFDQMLDQTQQQIVQNEFIQDGNQEFFNTRNQNNFDLQPASTFSLQEYKKTTINDHYFNGDNTNIKTKLNETIKQVYQYVESKIAEKQGQIEEFKKKLQKFIFDYRYDQNHQPRKYFHQTMSEQNLRQKFQDPKYDERKVNFDIQDFDETPFSLFANEVDIYINSLSNELCIKQAFYNELELYLKAVYQQKCDIKSNYLYERIIYHQCIQFTFKDTGLNLKIRIQPKKANLFRARDKIIQSFYAKNKTELNIFSSFVFYWAQKRQLLSQNVMEKNAWIILIIYFFQINKRLPPSINYDQLNAMAKNLENKCYQKAIGQLQQIKLNEKQGTAQKFSIDKVFDFEMFENESKSQFIVQYNPDQKPNTNPDQKKNTKNRDFTLENMKVFQVLPIIRPSGQDIHTIREASNFNYGFFFFKFLYFLNFQIVIDPISVSINGQIQRKKINNRNENAEPISIRDTIRPEINLVSHLSFQQDAFFHLVEQIKFTYTTLNENKSEKLFLQSLPTLVFNTQKREK
ncbi:hypothetical protein ABPG72_019856 [Tetrahymena utriculariae]